MQRKCEKSESEVRDSCSILLSDGAIEKGADDGINGISFPRFELFPAVMGDCDHRVLLHAAVLKPSLHISGQTTLLPSFPRAFKSGKGVRGKFPFSGDIPQS